MIMKASELIEKLQNFVERNGDHTIKIRDNNDYLWNIELIALSARSDEEDFIYTIWKSNVSDHIIRKMD